jgi:hypothetical protein
MLQIVDLLFGFSQRDLLWQFAATIPRLTPFSLYRVAMCPGIVLAALIAADLTAAPASGAAPCPTRAELDAELARVGAIGVAPPEITVAGEQMRVVLRGRDGATVGTRDVRAPATCHERATVAAVLVATWMGIWPKGPETASAIEKPIRPSGNVESSATASSPRSASAADTSPPAPPGASHEDKVEYGLALAAAIDRNSSATGIAIEARQALVGPLRGFVGLVATTERDQYVGSAVAGYLRPAFEAGAVVRIGRGRVQGEIGASGRLGMLFVRGKDLPVTHSATHAASAAVASLRLVIAGRRFSPFALATSAYWFGERRLTLDDDSAVAELPRWDFGLGVGLLWAP